MPALNGEVQIILRNGSGVAIFQIWEFFTPATGVLRDATVTTSTGSRTAAVVVDNMTGRAQRMTVNDAAGNELRSFNIKSAGEAFTVAQLAALTPAVTTISNLAGLSPALT